MKHLFFSLLILFFTFCRSSNPNKEMDAYFEKEIKNRIGMLEKHDSPGDSLPVNARAIDEEINKFILLSKDIENLSACVNKANAYFEKTALTFGINNTDFTKLNTGMHINDMASVLKQNELNLLNRLIFKYNPSQLIPFTAQ